LYQKGKSLFGALEKVNLLDIGVKMNVET
jgi:hypothetical protein